MRALYRDRPTVDVFYQISARPLFTISGKHVITQALEICGGRNVFADMAGLSPAVSLEAVIVAQPQAIVTGRFAATEAIADDPLLFWSEWTNVPAVRDGNLFAIDAELIARSSVRILDGIEQLCSKLDAARGKRG
jgi:iron complex transport system substrate-binding protein